MKTIWILNHYAKLGSGRHYKFSENLVMRGYNVKIFAASSAHNTGKNRISDSRKYISDSKDGVNFIYIKARDYIGNGKQRVLNMIDYAISLLSVSKEFDKEKPDIIIASSVHPLTWLAGYRLAKRYNAKLIAETRDLWPETLIAMGRIKRNRIPAKILYFIEKFIYKKADRLIFTFEGGKDYVGGIGLDASKVRYINNGVDLVESYKNKTKYIFEDKDLEDESSYKIVFAGAIGKANATYKIIEVAEIFMEKNIKNIKVIIFGDGPEKNNLEKYICEKGLENIIFKGRVDKKYIPSILSKTDLNILCVEYLPSIGKYGVSPNKLYDYFASGKPVVSNFVCNYDNIEKYKCGITVKDGSPEALAEGILKFYNMPEGEYNKYCENALIAAKDFDFKVLTDKLEEVIRELI